MGDVVPLPKVAPRHRERHFLCCSCSVDEGTGWIPIVVHDAEGLYICGLACLGCGREMRIKDGREAR